MSVIRRSAGADWLDRLAEYLAKEACFTTDATIPDGASTVDGLRVAADELEGAVEENERLREAVRVYLHENGRVRELCEAFGIKMPGTGLHQRGQ